MEPQLDEVASKSVDEELASFMSALGSNPAAVAGLSPFEEEWGKLVARAPFKESLSGYLRLSGALTPQGLQERLRSLDQHAATSPEPWTAEEDAVLQAVLKSTPTPPSNLADASKLLADLQIPGDRKRSVMARWFRLLVLAEPKPAAASPSKAAEKGKGPAQAQARPPDALPYNERVTYEVSPGVIESCTVIISGPNKGKYQDDRNPSLIFDNNQDWIRSKNANIPHSVGAS